MLNFGWTDYNPTEGSATSIDPLKSQAFATQLGGLVFPGTSGRVWRIRYMSALCFLLKSANLERGVSYRKNYLKFRKFENAFIICLNELKKKYKEKNLKRIIGLEKAEQYSKLNTSLNINGDILASQMSLGPLGVHAVLMKNLGLVDDDKELVLTPTGEKLANDFELAIGKKNRDIFLSKISDSRVVNVKPEYFTEITESFLFEFDQTSQDEENRNLQRLLFHNTIRRQLFQDMLQVETDFQYIPTENEIISHVVTLNSPLKGRYELILAYEMFQRYLHHYFNLIRDIPKDLNRFSILANPRLENAFSAVSGPLIESISDLIKKCKAYLETEEDPGRTISSIRSFASEVLTSTSNCNEFSNFLIKFHEKHQRDKGKAPWIHFTSPDNVEVMPSYVLDMQVPSLAEVRASNIHLYRFSNCLQMINDMQLESVL
jgi:hypothetical protein